jgi:hypothetical protein
MRGSQSGTRACPVATRHWPDCFALPVRYASVSGCDAPLAGLFRPTGPVRERVRLRRAIGRTVSPYRSGARACPVATRLAGLSRLAHLGRTTPYPKHRVIASSNGRIVSGVSSPMLETRNVLPLILPYPPSIWKPNSCRSR